MQRIHCEDVKSMYLPADTAKDFSAKIAQQCLEEKWRTHLIHRFDVSRVASRRIQKRSSPASMNHPVLRLPRPKRTSKKLFACSAFWAWSRPCRSSCRTLRTCRGQSPEFIKPLLDSAEVAIIILFETFLVSGDVHGRILKQKIGINSIEH